jgi:hypothetical protein
MRNQIHELSMDDLDEVSGGIYTPSFSRFSIPGTTTPNTARGYGSSESQVIPPI